MIELKKVRGSIEVVLKVVKMGDDLCIIITGGDKPHLGAVTVGEYLEGDITTSLKNHREHFITSIVYKELRKYCKENIVVCAGVHVDNITKDEIKDVIDIVNELTSILIRNLFQR